jgi:hypothetical protein
VLERVGCIVRRVPGCEQYDLEILTAPDGWPTGRVEVKRDKKHIETGNVAIEIERNSRPSGLAVTAAPVWAIVLHGLILLIRAADLRGIVANRQYRRVAAGDRNNTTVCLVPVERLRLAATHVLTARSRKPKNGPAWKATDSKPDDRRQRVEQHCVPAPTPLDRRQQSLFDGGAKW